MDDAEFQKLLNAEPPVVIEPNHAAKKAFFVQVAFVLCACAFLMIKMTFIISLVAVVPILIVGIGPAVESVNTILLLDQQNLTIKNKVGGDISSYPWKDIGDFVITRYGRGGGTAAYLTFKVIPKNRSRDVPLIKVGLEDEQWVQLMNHWRERALANSSN